MLGTGEPGWLFLVVKCLRRYVQYRYIVSSLLKYRAYWACSIVCSTTIEAMDPLTAAVPVDNSNDSTLLAPAELPVAIIKTEINEEEQNASNNIMSVEQNSSSNTMSVEQNASSYVMSVERNASSNVISVERNASSNISVDGSEDVALSPTTGDEQPLNPWTVVKCIFCQVSLTPSEEPKLLECLHAACGNCILAKVNEHRPISGDADISGLLFPVIRPNIVI